MKGGREQPVIKHLVQRVSELKARATNTYCHVWLLIESIGNIFVIMSFFQDNKIYQIDYPYFRRVLSGPAVQVSSNTLQ